jgi:uncharacterized protein YqhQ
MLKNSSLKGIKRLNFSFKMSKKKKKERKRKKEKNNQAMENSERK